MSTFSTHAYRSTRRGPTAALAAATLLAAVLAVTATPANRAGASAAQLFAIDSCSGATAPSRLWIDNITTTPTISIGTTLADGTTFGDDDGVFFDNGSVPAAWMNVGGVVRVSFPNDCGAAPDNFLPSINATGGESWALSDGGRTLTMLRNGTVPEYTVAVPAGITATVSGSEVEFAGVAPFELEVTRIGNFPVRMDFRGNRSPGSSFATPATLFAVGGLFVTAPPISSPPTGGSTSTTEPSPVDLGVAIAVEQAANVTGAGAVLVRGGAVVPMTTTLASGVGPRGGAVIEAEGMRITLDGGLGATESAGLLVAPDGEIVCEICTTLAADSVVEAWIYSTPRLAAAVRVEVDTTSGECPLLRIPVGSPLDGGDGIEAGAHTLQLRMFTDEGFEVVATGITVGGPVPASIPAGEGPVRTSVALLALGLLGAVVAVRGLQRRPVVDVG